MFVNVYSVAMYVHVCKHAYSNHVQDLGTLQSLLMVDLERALHLSTLTLSNVERQSRG